MKIPRKFYIYICMSKQLLTIRRSYIIIYTIDLLNFPRGCSLRLGSTKLAKYVNVAYQFTSIDRRNTR